MSRRNKADREEFQHGQDRALWLYRHLAQGGQLGGGLPTPGLSLAHNESCYADAGLVYARFYGLDVSVSYTEQRARFTLSPTRRIRDAIDKASNRREFERMSREAEQLATPQWHDHHQVRAVLTNQRILCDVDGDWLSFWHYGIVELAVDLPGWSFELHFDEGDPLMLTGPYAPSYALAVAYLRYGADSLRVPAFAPLATPPT